MALSRALFNHPSSRVCRVRHRAPPTFTVEVKTSRGKAEPVFKAADHQSGESRRVAEKLFSGSPWASRSRGRDGSLPPLDHALRRATLPQTPQQAPPAPARRVLPDLLQVEPTEARARPEAEG